MCYLETNCKLETQLGGIQMNISFFPEHRFRPGGPYIDFNQEEGEVYKLPGTEKKVYSIADGRQCLVQNSSGRVFFIGKDTDEAAHPFATELSPITLSVFENQGEEAFFDALVPEVVKDCKITFCEENHQRQGEVIAVKIADSWSEAREMLGFTGHLEKCFHVSKKSGCTIPGTQHKLTGERCVMRGKILKRPKNEGKGPKKSINVTGKGCYLVSGILEARDHSPLNLPGIHLVATTANRVDPRRGD